MHLQYIPSSASEVVTNTLCGAKGLLGYFFIVRDINAIKDDLPTVSITVDGTELCRDLMILPFASNYHKSIDGTQAGLQRDFREVNVQTCMNVEESVVKMSATQENLFDLVLILADKEVEDETIQWIDCVAINQSGDHQLNLRHKPSAMFAWGKGDSREIRINGNSEICPLLVDHIIPSYRAKWTEQRWVIQHPAMDKNIALNVGNFGQNDQPLYFYFISKQVR